MNEKMQIIETTPGVRREMPVLSEAMLRQELAACYRIFHYLGWTELIFNHISVRLPGRKKSARQNEVTSSVTSKVPNAADPLAWTTRSGIRSRLNRANFSIRC